MDQTCIDIDISTLKNHINPDSDYGMDESFFVSRIQSNNHASKTTLPIRFDGTAFFFCRRGSFRLILNTQEAIVPESSIVVIPIGSIVKFEPLPGKTDEEVDISIIAISKDYLFDLKFDISKILGQLPFEYLKPAKINIRPYIELDDKEFSIIEEHCCLLRHIYTSSLPSKKESITLVLSSILSILCSIASLRIKDLALVKDEKAASTRSKTVIMDFMELVRDHHEQERSVKFYADKMCLTPKYLSKLAKEATGHSASELIDNLVIAKAKNLLRYSDTAIKVIVAQLNFPNQSSFNKFFKAKTGMTPLQYRNSQ